MPPPLPEEFWGPFRDPLVRQNELYRGWVPRSLDVDHDMEKLKNFALRGKKIMVVGGALSPPLSPNVLSQVMQQGDEAWVGMSPRKLHVFHALDYFMGGTEAATLRQFGHVDHFETFCEGAEGRDVTGDVYQISLDDLSKHAEAITSQPAFKNSDVLVINNDVSFIVAHDRTFDDFTRYLIGRFDRAMTAIDALIEVAVPRMKKGGRIILLTNSLWALAITEAAYRNDCPLIAKNQALGRRAQEVMENHGIEISFLLNRIVHEARPLNWKSLRDNINYYAVNGYSVDMLRKIGSRVAAIAAVGMNCRNKEDEAIVYDNVLAELLHTPCHWGEDQSQERDHISHGLVIDMCFTDRYKAKLADDPPLPQPSWTIDVPLRYMDRVRGHIHDGRSRLHRSSTGVDCDPVDVWIEETVLKEVPLAGKVALILDSGRSDGVTVEVCLELARLGACIALTYVGEGENRSMAYQLVEKVRLAGGQAIALKGVPCRSLTYTDKEEGEDSYIGDLVSQALKAFGAMQLHVIVNNIGGGGGLLTRNVKAWKHIKYDNNLLADNICERKKLVHADSIRNMLALHYIVEACAEFGLLADGARVINIAGIGTAPSTAVDGRPFWDHHCKFMNFWHQKINQQTNLPEERVAFNTIIPCDAYKLVPQPRYEDKEDFLWMKAVDRYFRAHRAPRQAKETARVVGWLARPTSKVDTEMIAPDQVHFSSRSPFCN